MWKLPRSSSTRCTSRKISTGCVMYWIDTVMTTACSELSRNGSPRTVLMSASSRSSSCGFSASSTPLSPSPMSRSRTKSAGRCDRQLLIRSRMMPSEGRLELKYSPTASMAGSSMCTTSRGSR